MRIAINILAFYVAWFAAVLGAAHGWPIAAASACLAVVGLHLLLSARRGAEFGLVLASAAVGCGVETLLIQSGLVFFAASGEALAGFAPFWLVALWMAFATLVNVSLSWLKSRIWLAVILAAIGGPLSYYAGSKLGGMMLAEPIGYSLIAISLLWAVAFPLLIVFARVTDAEPRAA